MPGWKDPSSVRQATAFGGASESEQIITFGPTPTGTLQVNTTDHGGTLTEIHLKAKGKILWQQKTEDPLIGGVLAIAGGMVFTGRRQG